MRIIAPGVVLKRCMSCAVAGARHGRGGDTLTYAEAEPPVALSHVVSRFWLLSGRAAGGAPVRLVPDGRIEIVIQCSDLTLRTRAMAEGSVVVGQLSRPAVLPWGPELDLVGIRFRTGAARSLLHGRLEALTDRIVPLVEVSRRLRLRLVDALSPPAPRSELVARLAAVTRDSVRRPLDDVACALIEAARSPIGIDPRAVGLRRPMCARTLQRRVIAATGVRPSLLRRLLRFRRVLPMLHRAPIGTHSRIAQDVGYFDHAHLIRDFGVFAGLPPRAFFRSNDGNLCGLPGDGSRCPHAIARSVPSIGGLRSPERIHVA